MLDLIFPSFLLIVWLAVRLQLSSLPIEFDFDQQHGTFGIFLAHYTQALRLVVVMDLVAAVLAHSYQFSTLVSHACLAGAGCAVLLMVWLTVTYERYLHIRYPRSGGNGPSNYTPSKYALTIALAAGAILFTILGIGGVLV